MNSGVIITSALNTKFGVYSTEQRLEQTLATIKSVKEKIPGCVTFLLEMAGEPLTEEQKNIFLANVDHLIDFTSDKNVTGLYNSTNNWDVVKNVTEVMCFRSALNTFKQSGVTTVLDRMFKVSGRYTLTDQFDINYYDSYKVKPCIVVGKSKTSQFPFALTQVDKQYMSRLWSWPTALNDEIIGVYDNSLKFMYERLANKGYADIEHCLYKFLDQDKVLEKDVLGIQGNLGPNGAAIND